MEVWTQRVLCKVNVMPKTYFVRNLLCSYFHEPWKNEIYFLHKQLLLELSETPFWEKQWR